MEQANQKPFAQYIHDIEKELAAGKKSLAISNGNMSFISEDFVG